MDHDWSDLCSELTHDCVVLGEGQSHGPNAVSVQWFHTHTRTDAHMHLHTSSSLFFTHRPSGMHWTLNEEDHSIDLPACVNGKERPLSLLDHTSSVSTCSQGSDFAKLYRIWPTPQTEWPDALRLWIGMLMCCAKVFVCARARVCLWVCVYVKSFVWLFSARTFLSWGWRCVSKCAKMSQQLLAFKSDAQHSCLVASSSHIVVFIGTTWIR